MEATKTYTKRENARRAGIAAGVPAELVGITVHKDGDDVRFGWKAMETPAEPEVTTAATAVPAAPAPKKEPKPKVARIEQNGVKRPGPGKCLDVWEWLDGNGNCMPKDLTPVAAEKGWNLSNAQIELYQWRKFNGISGRTKTA